MRNIAEFIFIVHAYTFIIGAGLDYDSVDATQELSKLHNNVINGSPLAYQLLIVQARMI